MIAQLVEYLTREMMKIGCRWFESVLPDLIENGHGNFHIAFYILIFKLTVIAQLVEHLTVELMKLGCRWFGSILLDLIKNGHWDFHIAF